MASSAAATAAAAATGGLRAVIKTVPGMKLSEGAGVQICRTVGTPALRNLDPFLMLDELKLPVHQAAAGFPEHPHRGFETCSIMLEGRMEHKDSAGNQGVIGPGGVQWMTAGRGVLHSEMPVPEPGGRLWGFQLWINLPAKHKKMKPRYQDYQAADIPTHEQPATGSSPRCSVRVLAGEHTSPGAAGTSTTRGPISMVNQGLLLDVTVHAAAASAAPAANEETEQQGAPTATIPVPPGFAAFAYVFDGVGSISGSPARPGTALVLGPGDHITAAAAAGDGAPGGAGGAEGAGVLRFLLMAGAPIGEPIVQHGPFVMNTQAEIEQAFQDYRAGRLQDPADDVWAAA